MIKKTADFYEIIEKECCTGTGQAVLHQVIGDNEKYDAFDAYAIVTLGPDDSVGYHVHEGDMEIYTILEGSAIFNDNGTEVILNKFESGITYDGEGHAIRPQPGTTLKFLACTVKK